MTSRQPAAPNGPIVVVVDERGGVCARPATIRERIAARVHSDRLDHELAQGVPPEHSPELAVRAASLARMRTRLMLATSLRRLRRRSVVQETHVLAPLPDARFQHLSTVQDELDGVVRRLVAPVPVPARGVALVHVLLHDGAGPVHQVGSPERLRAALVSAASALDPSTDWPS